VAPDVIVVGGGVIGTAIAYRLALEGARVTVFDHSAPGQASAASAGMIAPGADAGLGPLDQLAAESARLYPALCAELLERTGIDAGLRQSDLLLTAWTEGEERELRGRRDRLGRARVQAGWLDGESLRDLEPALAAGVRCGLHVPGQHQVDPPALLNGLRRAAADLGAILRGEAVLGLERQGERVVGVRGATASLGAEEVVIAGGAWSGSFSADLRQPLPVRPVRGQMVALRPATSLLKTICFSSRAYLLRKAEGWIYVGATEEESGFDAGVTASGVRDLLAGAVALFPLLEHAAFSHARSGLRPATPDGLPLVGRVAGWSGITLATGHFREGVLLAPITAELVADLVRRRRPRLSIDALDPARFLPHAA
jgi:glycine oxidase